MRIEMSDLREAREELHRIMEMNRDLQSQVDGLTDQMKAIGRGDEALALYEALASNSRLTADISVLLDEKSAREKEERKREHDNFATFCENDSLKSRIAAILADSTTENGMENGQERSRQVQRLVAIMAKQEAFCELCDMKDDRCARLMTQISTLNSELNIVRLESDIEKMIFSVPQRNAFSKKQLEMTKEIAVFKKK
jgi:hypothetical protein